MSILKQIKLENIKTVYNKSSQSLQGSRKILTISLIMVNQAEKGLEILHKTLEIIIFSRRFLIHYFNLDGSSVQIVIADVLKVEYKKYFKSSLFTS